MLEFTHTLFSIVHFLMLLLLARRQSTFLRLFQLLPAFNDVHNGTFLVVVVVVVKEKKHNLLEVIVLPTLCFFE